MRFFSEFRVGIGTTHADLLRVNALALAARRGVEIEVHVADSSTVAVRFPNGNEVVGSDWNNLHSAIARA